LATAPAYRRRLEYSQGGLLGCDFFHSWQADEKNCVVEEVYASPATHQIGLQF
jgi:hypothetical protein